MESLIYFAQRDDGGAIKIGCSTHVVRRRGELQVANDTRLRIVAVMPGTKQIERELHGRFRHLKVSGEWFAPDRALVTFIQQVQKQHEGAVMGKRRSGMTFAKTPDDVYGWSQVIRGAIDGVLNRKLSVNEGRFVAYSVGKMQQGIALRQEQARLSGNRVAGDVLMNIKNNPNAAPTPNTVKRRKASR